MNSDRIFIAVIIVLLLTATIWIPFLEGVWKEAKLGERLDNLEPASRQYGRNLVRWITGRDDAD